MNARLEPTSVVFERVRAATSPRRVAFLPELALHLADDFTALWETLPLDAGRTAPPPYWACLWPGGQALARLLLDQPELVAGRDVLDVGSGGGASAMAAALAGARRVVAVDPDALALRALSANATLNHQPTTRVDLSSASTLTRGIGLLQCDAFEPRLAALPFDVVLAGDVFYEAELAAKALRWLHARPCGAGLVLVGDPGRTYFDPRGMRELAHYTIPVTDIENTRLQSTRVYAICP